MRAADTSVVVAAFASWHELHEQARTALDEQPRLPAHCAFEAYSVLTRLPPPHRAAPETVRGFLVDRFREPYLVLSAKSQRALSLRLADLGISGGATYDALVATTAAEAGAVLATCDRRARPIYERCGVDLVEITRQ